MLATLFLAATLHVSAAASLSDALTEIAAGYKPDTIVLNFGASSTLARQIEAGAPVDVFISADEQKMDQLRGLVVARRTILSNTLVIVTTSDSRIASPRDLLAVRRLALAEPRSVPAGIYAKQYLTKLGLWDRIAPNVIPLDNVRAALSAVEAGNADAAIVYKTDALISKKVRVAYEVPRKDGPKISYPAAVVTDSKAARRFVDYLGSDAARAIFRKYGFLLP